MPGFNPDNINIHNLTVEEPEKQVELAFDPEKEVTREDWEGMKEGLKSFRANDAGVFYSSQAMAMKVLFPERAKELDLNEGMWKEMKGDLDQYREKDLWKSFLDKAMEMKLLYPEKAGELGLNEEIWNILQDVLDSMIKAKSWNVACSTAMQMKILYPEKNFSVDERVWDTTKSHLGFPQSDGEVNWESFCTRAMEMRIVFPEKWNEISIGSAVWAEMGETLEWLRQKSQMPSMASGWLHFSKQAMGMKVLAADQVKVTGKGLEIMMPGKKLTESEIAEMPEQRKF